MTMAMNITTQAATSADREDLLRLLGTQLNEHNVFLKPEQLAHAIDGMLAEPRRGRILVAHDGTKLVGVAVLAYTWTLEHGGQSTWLDELYVEPTYRSRGIGTQLLHAAMSRAKEDGCVAMDLEVEASHARAQALYLREGFTAHTRSRFVRVLDDR